MMFAGGAAATGAEFTLPLPDRRLVHASTSATAWLRIQLFVLNPVNVALLAAQLYAQLRLHACLQSAAAGRWLMLLACLRCAVRRHSISWSSNRSCANAGELDVLAAGLDQVHEGEAP